jgi:hypothetical protein
LTRNRPPISSGMVRTPATSMFPVCDTPVRNAGSASERTVRENAGNRSPSNPTTIGTVRTIPSGSGTTFT